MNAVQALDQVIQQAQFAEIVGVSEARVSQLVADGLLVDGATGLQWMRAYCGRLRDQAAGRYGMEDGPLNFTQEKAALARAQREGVEIKNAVLRGQYADVSLLAQCLAAASQAVSQRIEHLPGIVRKSMPDLPPELMDQVMAVLASARSEWDRKTAELVAATLLTTDDEPDLLEGMADEPRAD